MLQQLNSPFLYLVCGLIILFVAAVCVIFLVRDFIRRGRVRHISRARVPRREGHRHG